MGAETGSGWILHSTAQGRKFGPLSEEELRNYFRAGMVKSIDRLTAPGEFAMRSAAEVATLLGEAVPPGPPPPEITQAPTPLPSMAAGVRPDSDEEKEARIARAMAAANIDLAVLAASGKPPQRRSWGLPILGAFVLIAMMLVALTMAQKLKSPKPAPRDGAESAMPGMEAAPAAAPAATPADPGSGLPGAGGTSNTEAADAEFHARHEQAEALAQTQKWPELLALARPWSQANPGRIEPLRYLGMAQARSGDASQAIESLEALLAREPADVGARKLLADVYLQAQRWPQAISLYKELVAAESQDARLWNNYGSALFQGGQKAQAEAALQTAVRLDPGFSSAWMNLGNLYKANGDEARAAAAFASAKQ